MITLPGDGIAGKERILSAMKKPTVFLTGAAGGMGYQSLIRMAKDADLYNTLLLVRNSEKNRKLLANMEHRSNVEIVWGDLNDYDAVYRCVKKATWCCTSRPLSPRRRIIRLPRVQTLRTFPSRSHLRLTAPPSR